MNKKEIKDLIDRKDFYYKESKRYKYILQYIGWSVMLIVGIIFLILAFYHPESTRYSIFKTECHNETKQLPCSLIEYHQKQIYVCPQYYIEDTVNITGVSVQLPQEEVCNRTEVNELFYADTSCISHSANQEYALLNCFTTAKADDLSEGWLYHHGECIEKTCDCGLGKDVCSKDQFGWKSECHETVCKKYKIQDYEVEIK